MPTRLSSAGIPPPDRTPQAKDWIAAVANSCGDAAPPTASRYGRRQPGAGARARISRSDTNPPPPPCLGRQHTRLSWHCQCARGLVTVTRSVAILLRMGGWALSLRCPCGPGPIRPPSGGGGGRPPPARPRTRWPAWPWPGCGSGLWPARCDCWWWAPGGHAGAGSSSASSPTGTTRAPLAFPGGYDGAPGEALSGKAVWQGASPLA